MPWKVGAKIETITEMTKAQISMDGGVKWEQYQGLVIREEFDLGQFTSQFTNVGINSKLSFTQGLKVVEITTKEGFTLEVSGSKLIVKSYEDLHSLVFRGLDLTNPKAKLLVAKFGGGIGIADIRDTVFVVRGFVFDLNHTKLSLYPSNTQQVTVYFSDTYRLNDINA